MQSRRLPQSAAHAKRTEERKNRRTRVNASQGHAKLHLCPTKQGNVANLLLQALLRTLAEYFITRTGHDLFALLEEYFAAMRHSGQDAHIE